MKLTHLSLANVRNYADLQFEPAAGLNVFIGGNAQGKSNLLEAIAMLGTGKSFRTHREADMIRNGIELAVISGDAHVRAGSVRLSCSIAGRAQGSRKTYAINGQNVRYASFLGRARVVTFVPADLQLVVGPPGQRRSLLNLALAQEQPPYYRALARYGKALAQKNALLKDDAFDRGLLDVYDRVLVEAGAVVMLARGHFCATVAAEARAAHAKWAPKERLEVRYVPNVPIDVPTADAVAAAFEQRLRERAAAERARKVALVGPHRDDVEMLLDGVSLAVYGSQGQQRTAVLAIKVAEYTAMHLRTGEAPLLLLDDVLSELDEGRAAAFLGGVGDFEQAFVTATHLPTTVPGACVWTVRNAALEPAA